MKVKVPGFKMVMGKLMSSIWPSLSLGNELDSSKISRDKEVVKKYDQDPFKHGKVTARWFTELLASMEKAHRLAPTMKLPMLMQVRGTSKYNKRGHGGDIRLRSWLGFRRNIVFRCTGLVMEGVYPEDGDR